MFNQLLYISGECYGYGFIGPSLECWYWSEFSFSPTEGLNFIPVTGLSGLCSILGGVCGEGPTHGRWDLQKRPPEHRLAPGYTSSSSTASLLQHHQCFSTEKVTTKDIQITLQGERVRGEGMHYKKMTVIYAYLHRSDSSLLRASLDHWITGSLDHGITGSLDHWITGSLNH